MTVSVQTTFNAYTGNGVTTVFPFQFKILSASDLQVYVAGVLKTLNVDYTVSGIGVDVGGSATLVAAPAAAASVSLIRAMTAKRTTDYQQLGDFLTPVVNPDFDNPILLIQDLQTQVSRSIRTPVDEVGTILTLPSIANRTAKFIAFDALGQPIASAGTGGGDAALRTDLAATTAGNDGARLSGFRRSESGAVARSVALALSTVCGVNLADFVTDFTGATDQTTNINNAITAAMSAVSKSNAIFHPGGVIRHDSQINVPAGLGVIGLSRQASEFRFMGSPAGSPANTRSAWRFNSGVVNGSGYAQVRFRHVTINYVNSVNFSAGIELSAGGYAYFDLYDVRVVGNCSFGVVLDSVELCYVHHCLIENVSGITTGANIWITNGADRSAGQTTGFSNVISIRDNQLAGGGAAAAGGVGAYGIIDDGGNEHTITGNNFDGHRFQMILAGVTTLTCHGNSFETPLTTGTANVNVGNLTAAGNNVGPCEGGTIHSNGFFGNLSAGSLLAFSSQTYTITGISKAASAVITINTVSAANPFFVGCPITITGVAGMTEINFTSSRVSAVGGVSGAWTVTIPVNSTGFGVWSAGGAVSCYASGFDVGGNLFGSQAGRGAAVDVTYLANSRVGGNTDQGNASMFHYTGVHTDALGNTLFPPQNGFPGTININGPIYGDNRLRHTFTSGINFAFAAIPYSASMAWDLKTANVYEVNITNAAAMTLNSPGNAIQGNLYTVTFKNTSGGAAGALTVGGSMRLAGAWVQPATGNQRSVTFAVDAGGISHEISRSAADVTN